MAFPDPSLPIATCVARDCSDCQVAAVVHCHFGPRDLANFLLISMPGFVIGGAGVLTPGTFPLVIWIAIIVAFFGFLEIRVMCSHCPHYAENGYTLGCWANHGAPKLWKYRPGPMSTIEKSVFFGGLVTVWVYPLPFLILAERWVLFGLYVLASAGFFAALKKLFCIRCLNFACPLNSVGESAREMFFQRNPTVGIAWGKVPREGHNDDRTGR